MITIATLVFVESNGLNFTIKSGITIHTIPVIDSINIPTHPRKNRNLLVIIIPPLIKV